MNGLKSFLLLLLFVPFNSCWSALVFCTAKLLHFVWVFHGTDWQPQTFLLATNKNSIPRNSHTQFRTIATNGWWNRVFWQRMARRESRRKPQLQFVVSWISFSLPSRFPWEEQNTFRSIQHYQAEQVHQVRENVANLLPPPSTSTWKASINIWIWCLELILDQKLNSESWRVNWSIN